jgi:hypothetical protein
MKLAICFYGQPRFLDNTCVYNRYKDIISLYNPDVYIHSWIAGANASMDSSDWSKKFDFKEQDRADELLIKMYSPKKYKFDSPIRPSLSESTRKKAEALPYYTANNEINMLSHLKTRSESIGLIDNPSEYDFVLVTRPDLYIFSLPDLTNLEKNRLYLTGDLVGCWTDPAILTTPEFLEAYSTVYDNIDYVTDRVLAGDSSKRNFIAEHYIYHNYASKFPEDRVSWTKDLMYKIVRNSDCLSHIV